MYVCLCVFANFRWQTHLACLHHNSSHPLHSPLNSHPLPTLSLISLSSTSLHSSFSSLSPPLFSDLAPPLLHPPLFSDQTCPVQLFISDWRSLICVSSQPVHLSLHDRLDLSLPFCVWMCVHVCVAQWRLIVKKAGSDVSNQGVCVNAGITVCLRLRVLLCALVLARDNTPD